MKEEAPREGSEQTESHVDSENKQTSRKLLALGYLQEEISSALSVCGDKSVEGIATYIDTLKKCKEEKEQREHREQVLKRKEDAKKAQEISNIEKIRREREEEEKHLTQLRTLIREDVANNYMDLEKRRKKLMESSPKAMGGGLLSFGTPLKTKRPELGSDEILVKIIHENKSILEVFKQTTPLSDLKPLVKKEFGLKKCKVSSLSGKASTGLFLDTSETFQDVGIKHMDTLYINKA